jgi:hypothetical protein
MSAELRQVIMAGLIVVLTAASLRLANESALLRDRVDRLEQAIRSHALVLQRQRDRQLRK